jgi:hypothetical protein
MMTDDERLIAEFIAAGRVTVIPANTYRCEHMLKRGVRCEEEPAPGETRCAAHCNFKARRKSASIGNATAAAVRRKRK